MPFGFGFNKAKVLASAEKNVKAGKLQQAIADYEKIIKEDAKDLTVLNTIGDLYSRLGKTEQATTYYKRVGDAFASNGFTVKAIAMYKKITKLDSSSVDSLTRLAELYAQQGLHSDARTQYAHVAEQHLKAGSLDKAAHVFQKVLDLDPENVAMQAKLAELYVKLNKKNEARDIYFRNAELYRSRKNFPAADESLKQVLAIDKTFSQAILLRGLVKMEVGDAAAAVECLEHVPDLDSRPEGLRSLLKAFFKLGKLDSAGPLARKLHTVFHETHGLTSYGEALIAANRTEEALAFYSEFAEILLSGESETVIQALQGCISRVKDNPASLEQLAGLMERAGQTTDLAEIKELLAHACVQSGDLAKARDLYRELARIEPDNPLHTQNYRQVLAKLGDDPSGRALTADEAAQPALVDELEGKLPEITQEYAPELAEAVRAALTEAELFDSYNLPAKAVTPLEAVLGRVPQDAQVNQRLASLYARTGRLADAGARCRVLEQVYTNAGFAAQAKEYAELAVKYGSGASAPAVVKEVAKLEAKATIAAFDFPQATADPGAVSEFEFTSPAPEQAATTPAAFELEFTEQVPAEKKPVVEASKPKPQPVVEAKPVVETKPVVEAKPVVETKRVVETKPVVAEKPAPAAEVAAVQEFDLSSEWDEMVDVEDDAVVEVEVVTAASHDEPVAHVAEPVEESQVASIAPEELSAETIALAAEAEPSGAHEFEFADAPGDSDAAIFEMIGTTRESGYPERVSGLIEEIRFYASQDMWDEAQSGLRALEREAPEAAHDLRAELRGHRPTEAAATPAPSTPLEPKAPVAVHEQSFDEAPLELMTEAEAPTVEVFSMGEQPEAAALDDSADLLAELETTMPAHADVVEAPAEPVLQLVDLAANAQNDSFESLLDLDSALGADFEIAAPAHVAAEPQHVAAVAASQTMSAAAGSTGGSGASAFGGTAVAEPPSFSQPPTTVAQPSPVSGNASHPDGAVDFSEGALADIFAEFKHDMEVGGGSTGEDPETHYNLGVAFKEMGLLDEAIGELQKVCQAIDRGQAFPQVLQAYTWLADCFVQKGVPEAAIRWYEKALRSPHVEGETATAIHYELACACEQAGNRGGALTHFMEVYGANIDYRDVAERIKTLKA